MNRRRQILISAVCAIFVAIATMALAAGFPTSISYQGTMVDKSGVPVTGSKSVSFALYSTTGGATSFWNETHPVTVTNGQFSAQLGSITPLDAGKFSGKTYLGLKVGSDPEMTPRQQLVSVPYAMNGSPVGTVNAFAGTVEPPGWLFCDGRSLLRSAYPVLFAVIGTAHGASDADHFSLPDYRGRFLRGVAGTSNADPDKNGRTFMDIGGNAGNAVGSVQVDQISSHGHPGSYTPSFNGGGFGAGGGNISMNTSPNSSNPVTVASFGGSEARPKNAYVNWIIKY
jgi:Phage Tail Collar Domain